MNRANLPAAVKIEHEIENISDALRTLIDVEDKFRNAQTLSTGIVADALYIAATRMLIYKTDNEKMGFVYQFKELLDKCGDDLLKRLRDLGVEV